MPWMMQVVSPVMRIDTTQAPFAFATARPAASYIETLRSQCDLAEFGRLLHEGWSLKRRLSDRVSTPDIDTLYDTALRAGAIGGKLLGAGGGGFLLLFVRPEHRAKIRSALPQLIDVPFRFDTSGCRIVLYQPDGW